MTDPVRPPPPPPPPSAAPPPPAAEPRGQIYDLGYRNYEGERLGRAYAFRSLMTLSIRNTFGIGRGALPKVLAFGLAALAFIPALLVLAFGALGAGDFEIVEHQDYFGLIQIVIVLFVAAMASDLVGNDRKNNTLALYFSRPIARDDYVAAKIAALSIALLALTLLPQLLVFIGNWLGASDSTEWLGDNWDQLPRILVSAVLVSVHLAALGTMIASFTKRRAFALTSILAVLLFSVIATGILVTLLGRGWAAITMAVSPLYLMQAVTLVVFDAVPSVTPFSNEGEIPDQIAFAEISGALWFVALGVQTALAALVAGWRYRREL